FIHLRANQRHFRECATDPVRSAPKLLGADSIGADTLATLPRITHVFFEALQFAMRFAYGVLCLTVRVVQAALHLFMGPPDVLMRLSHDVASGILQFPPHVLPGPPDLLAHLPEVIMPAGR